MTDPVGRALRELAATRITTANCAASDVRFTDLFAVYADLRKGDSAIRGALAEVVLRLLEMALLRDPVISTLVERWDALVGQARDMIANRVHALSGSEAPDELVTHFFRIAGGTAARRGRRTVDHNAFVPGLFEDVGLTHPRRELRCPVCGYHFQEADLGAARLNLAKAYELVLAKHPEAGRADNRDPLKPMYADRRSQRFSYTQLTVDHIVPEEGLGSSGPENLELMCRFCNEGKLAHRWALEPVSVFAVAGLSDFPVARDCNKVMQTTIVSAYRYYASSCTECKRASCDVELTVRRCDHADANITRTFTPWNLKALCYECASSEAH